MVKGNKGTVCSLELNLWIGYMGGSFVTWREGGTGILGMLWVKDMWEIIINHGTNTEATNT